MHKPSKAIELRALQERNELLESLSDVGVALAASFDIRTILQTTHDAASGLAKAAAIDVLYVGCEAINSRPMWYPAEPSVSGLTQAVRRDVHARASAAPNEPRYFRPTLRCAVPRWTKVHPGSQMPRVQRRRPFQRM